MAQISIAEIYSGEKYGVMSAAIAAGKMRHEGDTVSGMNDDVSSSSYVGWDDGNA